MFSVKTNEQYKQTNTHRGNLFSSTHNRTPRVSTQVMKFLGNLPTSLPGSCWCPWQPYRQSCAAMMIYISNRIVSSGSASTLIQLYGLHLLQTWYIHIRKDYGRKKEWHLRRVNRSCAWCCKRLCSVLPGFETQAFITFFIV